jgi:acetate kinase
MEIPLLVESLYDKDNNLAYKSLQELESISEENNSVYCYMDEFIKMLEHSNSYIRVRGFRLICKNAKWDENNKINEHIDTILQALDDEKPIAVRQCLAFIKEIIAYKKELQTQIKERLLNINPLKYKDTMQGLICKDIDSVLALLIQ